MDGSGLRYRDAFINFPPFAQTIYIQEGAEFKIQCAQVHWHHPSRNKHVFKLFLSDTKGKLRQF